MLSHSHPYLCRRPPILAGNSGPVYNEVTSFFPGFWCARPCMHPQRVEFSASSPVEFLCDKMPVVFKTEFSGGSCSPIVKVAGWGSLWRRLQDFYSYRICLWYNYFRFVGYPPNVMRVDFIVIVPFILLQKFVCLFVFLLMVVQHLGFWCFCKKKGELMAFSAIWLMSLNFRWNIKKIFSYWDFRNSKIIWICGCIGSFYYPRVP